MTSVHYWSIGLVVYFSLLLTILQWKSKLPPVSTVQDLAAAVNSRGGNILVLAFFSVGFFWSALKFTYWIIARASDGKITVENSVAMAAFTWMTGSAFGGAFTSMVKAMTGESSKARQSDTNGNNNTETHDVPVIQSTHTKPPSQENNPADGSQTQPNTGLNNPSDPVYGVQLRGENK